MKKHEGMYGRLLIMIYFRLFQYVRIAYA